MSKALLWMAIAVVPVLAAAQSDRPPASVEVTRAEIRNLAPSVVATGQVRSRSGAQMAAGIAGPLDWVAEPGTRFAKDDVLARVDTGEIRLQRAEQAARVTRSEVALRQAQRELERLRASGNAVSRYQIDQAENTRDLAASDLEIARATLRQTEDRLARAAVRAPFAGVVAERLRREGEEVARGDVLLQLQDTDHLEIRLFLPLRHVRAITAGSAVTVLPDDGEPMLARVRAIVPVGDARTQSFEALIDASALALAVGRTVKVELPLQAAVQRLAIPRDALVIRSDGLSVYRVTPDNVAQRVSVTTGVAEGDWVAVEGGLADHDAVVVRGAETLQDGAPVKIIGERKTWISGASSQPQPSQS